MKVIIVISAIVLGGMILVQPDVSSLGSSACRGVTGTDSLYGWCGDWLTGDCNNVVGNSDYPPCTSQGGKCDECSRNYTLSSCFLQTGYTCFYDIFDCGRLEQGTCGPAPDYPCQNKTTYVRECSDIQITLVNCP